MKRAEEVLEKALPYASAVAGQRHLLAMRDAMIHIVPFTLVSSVFMLIFHFPWTAYQNFMTRLLGEGWQGWESGFIRPATVGIIALIGAVSAAASLSKSYGHDGTESGVLALTAVVILVGRIGGIGEIGDWGLQSGFAGQWLWLAMLAGIGTAELHHRVSDCGALKKLPPVFARSIEPLMPVFLVAAIFSGIRLLGSLVFRDMFGNIWMQWIQRPLFRLGTSLPATLLIQAINSIFWGLGLHGAQLVNSVMLPIWTTQMLENLQVFASGGTVMPNIVTKQFIELFIWIGGSAGSLSLVIWIKMFAKSKHVKQVGEMAFLPALFNIDEPVVFGLPVALNPILIIPYIVAPLATTAFSYIMMKLGIFPMLYGIDLSWTTPVLISGFMATNGNIMGAVLQLCNMGISFFVYAPFIYLYDRRMAMMEK